jgi:hypothetical protein
MKKYLIQGIWLVNLYVLSSDTAVGVVLTVFDAKKMVVDC